MSSVASFARPNTGSVDRRPVGGGLSEAKTMCTFVVLMRGINVGSTRKLPMAELRALCVKAGLRRPETYIQSGNLIVDADLEADDVRALLETAIATGLGLRVDVIVRRAAHWHRYIAANPFADDAATLPKMLHLFLSREPLKAGAAEELAPKARAGERMAAAGGALWIDYGADGVAKSKLTPLLVDKACGSPATGRNWNSVLKIGEMIEARGQRQAK
jgi:uncharacterized protein (DUF1697 family)